MVEGSDIYDLLILVDATYSMSHYLASLHTSLPKIISISALTDSFSRIGLLAYRDYSDDDLLEWSGWMSSTGVVDGELQVDLLAAAKRLSADGGGDYPEATKTGLAKAYEVMRESATTIILLYTDAPPHTLVNSNSNTNDNHALEQRALEKPDSYSGFGPAFMDWVHAGRMMALLEDGKKRAQIFSILEPSMNLSDGNYYTFLSTITGGACFYLDDSTPKDISMVTVDILLAWMGVAKTGTDVAKIGARLSKYKNSAGIQLVKKEAVKAGKTAGSGTGNIEQIKIDSEVLKRFMPKRKVPVQDFAQRYRLDDAYKRLTVEHLQKIINEDVSAIALNPVFGSLWRVVCNDRKNENLEVLVSSFGMQIDRIADAGEKEQMKNWLAESYDYSAEVQEIIASVPDSQKFPCLYLDPTLMFIKSSGTDKSGDENPITEFRRDELLEIGRSCDPRVLRRLGQVLTRLTFVNSHDELPIHILNAEEGMVTRIPLALASKELDRKFWKILLHIVVPGTMLSARPAALLAALAIRLGIQPLLQVAITEMLMWRDKWNDLEIPETWNASCLSLLLDANKAYLGQNNKSEKVTRGLLRTEDAQLFDRLVSYQMLESNLMTVITAEVGWKPEKTYMPIGPVVLCRSCLYPRSVTIMGKNSQCGNCLATDYKTQENRQDCINKGVTKDDNEGTDAAWVECCVRTCRAQYVVYNPNALNVRAKCYYCRQRPEKKIAPWLECGQCLNRVIFPKEYRTSDHSPFQCVACSIKRKSIIKVETTARALSKENTTAWLLENKTEKMISFCGRSLFFQITQAGTADFCNRLILFPQPEKQKLTLNGKHIHNTPELIAQLKSWVSSRRTESGTCSLCFSELRKRNLNPACGRRGCEQLICRDCLSAWYGLNAAGRIINTAALSCPFCRRAPTSRTLSNYSMGIYAVGNLRGAVERSGEWVYAWCLDCAIAKQYLERVCAAGAPRELADWVCDSCEQQREENARREIAILEAEIASIDAARRQVDFQRRAAAQLEIEEARKRKNNSKLVLKKCPGCKALTEKSFGCGHMTCICGKHWCWFCSQLSEPRKIYAHMETVHGGYYDADDADDDGDEEQYDELR